MVPKEFHALLKTIKDESVATVVFPSGFDVKQWVQLAEALKTNRSVKRLSSGLSEGYCSDVIFTLGNMLKQNRTLHSLDIPFLELVIKLKICQLNHFNFARLDISEDFIAYLEESDLHSLGLSDVKFPNNMISLLPRFKKAPLYSLDLRNSLKYFHRWEIFVLRLLTDSKLIRLVLAGIEYSKYDDIRKLAPHINQLISLDLSYSGLDDTGIGLLASYFKGNQLRELNVTRNKITAKGLKLMGPHLKDSQLRILKLGSNEIGVKGLRTLVPYIKGSPLRRIDLSLENNISLYVSRHHPEFEEDSEECTRRHQAELQRYRQDFGETQLLVQPLQASQLHTLTLTGYDVCIEAKVQQFVNDILRANQKKSEEAVKEIQQTLKTLEANFKLLHSPFRDRVPDSQVSLYVEQCRDLYSQAKKLLQAWEELAWNKKLRLQVTGDWEILFWQGIDKLPPEQQRSLSHLPYAWIGWEKPKEHPDQKEVKEKEEELKTTIETMETPSSAAVVDFHRRLTMREQQLTQRLWQQEQAILPKIDSLETQCKDNATQALEQELLKLREQQIGLLERQINPFLLINRFETIDGNPTTQGEALDVLRLQLPQKLDTSMAQAEEDPQKREAPILRYIEQLKAQFQTQSRILNERMNSLKTKLEAGDTSQQIQLKQLQQEHAQLMEGYKARQKIIAKHQRIESSEALRLFNRSVQVKLQELFLAYKVLDSGMVQRSQYKTKDKIADAIQIAGEWIPLPYATEVTGIFSKLLQHRSDKEEERRAEVVAYLAIGFAAIDKIAEQTAMGLCDRYEEQILCLKPEGAKILGECSVKYMIAYITGGLLKQDQSLVGQFLYSVLTLDVHNGWWPKTHKSLATLPSVKGWTDNGAFKHPGIRTTKNTFFSDSEGEKTKPWKYGYCLGTAEEALQAGLIQTAERVVSKIKSQQPLRLTPADHNQVANVTAATQHQAEQIERLQIQLQQAHDMRIKESEKQERHAKENSELREKLLAQSQEMEALKRSHKEMQQQFQAFMASFQAQSIKNTEPAEGQKNIKPINSPSPFSNS